MTERRDRWHLCVVLAAFCGYLLVLPIVLERLNPLTGDEPFYVMTAISLMRDRNLDETANYARRDYEEFYPPDPLPTDWRGWPAFPRILPPHPAVTDRDGLYTKHGLGLSVLIAVPYELAGRVGAVLVIMLCAALLTGQMFLLGMEAGASRGLAASLALLLAWSLPIAPYALLLFPEIPAALLLTYAVRRAGASNASWQGLLTGSAIGLLPWLHQRFSLTAAALAAIVLANGLLGKRDRWALAGLVPIALGGVTLIAYNLWLYGRPVQNAADHAGFNDIAGSINGFFGLLLDAQWGLLMVAPGYILAIVALPLWYRTARYRLFVTTAAVVPYVTVVAAYRVWWGEWGPPARYLVPILPLAAGPLAALVTRASLRWRIVAVACTVPSLALTFVALGDLQRLYHHPDGHNRLIGRVDDLLGSNLATYLVPFQPFAMAPLHERLAAGMAVVALVLTSMLIVYVVPRLRPTRPSARVTTVVKH
jgi:hypothetical protein